MTDTKWGEVYKEFLEECTPNPPSHFEMEKFLKWLNENYNTPIRNEA